MARKKLTTRFVNTAIASSARIEVRDAIVQGLELRISKSGAKAWAFRYRRKSDRAKRTITLGDHCDYTLSEARMWGAELRLAVARGADPAAEQQEKKRAETFSEIAAEWVERHGRPNKHPQSVHAEVGMLNLHVFPAIGAMKAAEITKRDLLRLFDAIVAKPDGRMKRDAANQRTLTHQPNRIFEIVRAIFRWAVGRDLLKSDPTWGMSAPIKKERARERELSPDEIRLLWTALNRAPTKRRPTKGVPRGSRILNSHDLPMTRATALTLKLALATAQRIGEVACIAMTELDLNETAPMWVIPAERSKNGQSNRVPLSPLALSLIQEARALAEHTPWLFPNSDRSGPIYSHAPTKAMQRARPALGLPDFRIHDLRRTAATRMAELGISPHVIAHVLNHVSVTKATVTGRVYNQYSYDREKREALGSWGARLAEIVGESTASATMNVAKEINLSAPASFIDLVA